MCINEYVECYGYIINYFVCSFKFNKIDILGLIVFNIFNVFFVMLVEKFE